jgi:hypothetical protein
MRVRSLSAILFALILGLGWSGAWADEPFPDNVTFNTLIKTPLAIEGLTGDNKGNLYTTGRGGSPCPVWRINLFKPFLEVVGNIVAAGCSPSGIALNKAGQIFMSDGDKVYTLAPNADNPPIADVYATGVPGTNGLAFDRKGNLWTGDGTTGLGRVWKIAPCSTLPCPAVEVFRIQPMRNGTDLGGDVIAQTGVTSQGVGRQNRTFPPGTLTITVPASATPTVVTPAGGQDLVANGLAFDRKGTLFAADTARGAIWRIEFDENGNLKSRTGCDSTFTDNTLCLENIFVTHPLLEGTDGIALDREGNIWNSANERNAIVVVARTKRVLEVFRNDPDATTLLRNTGPLEFPTSPFLLGKFFCTANSDGNRRDNSPATAGEIKSAGPDVGKISCMRNSATGDLIQLKISGLPLPVE